MSVLEKAAKIVEENKAAKQCELDRIEQEKIRSKKQLLELDNFKNEVLATIDGRHNFTVKDNILYYKKMQLISFSVDLWGHEGIKIADDHVPEDWKWEEAIIMKVRDIKLGLDKTFYSTTKLDFENKLAAILAKYM